MSLTEKQWNEAFKCGKDYTPLNRFFLAELLESVELAEGEGQRVLDLGCGTGGALAEFAEKGFSGVGVDFSEEALRLAKERAEEGGKSRQLTFQKQDLNNFSADEINGEFEIVFSKLVYAFIEDKPEFLRSVKEITDRSSGVFVLITPVLYEGVEYDDFLESISAPYEEIQRKLEEVFDEVKEFKKEYFRKQGVRMTFVCK